MKKPRELHRESTFPDNAGVSPVPDLSEEIVVLSYPIPQLRFPYAVTKGEREIIELLLDGLSTREIATRRSASEQTVSKQLAAIYSKAGVRSRGELIAWMLGRRD